MCYRWHVGTRMNTRCDGSRIPPLLLIYSNWTYHADSHQKKEVSYMCNSVEPPKYDHMYINGRSPFTCRQTQRTRAEKNTDLFFSRSDQWEVSDKTPSAKLDWWHCSRKFQGPRLHVGRLSTDRCDMQRGSTRWFFFFSHVKEPVRRFLKCLRSL